MTANPRICRLAVAISGCVLLLISSGRGSARPSQAQQNEQDSQAAPAAVSANARSISSPAPEGQPAAPAPADIPTRAAAAPNYVIGPEDVLEIEVFDLPELRKTVRVANDGTISLALLGYVKASGLTAKELRQQLEMEYGATYLEKPEVTVSVLEFHSQPVLLIGALEKAGTYQLTGPRTLIEMISMAGGLANRPGMAAGSTLTVTRRGGFGDLEIKDGMKLLSSDRVEINVHKLVYAHDEALNIQIKPYDSITVSLADIIYVMGEVKRPGAFVLDNRENVTVMQALALSEGLLYGASSKKSQIIRRGPDGYKKIPLDVRKIFQGKTEDPLLLANDILYIPSSVARNVAKRGTEIAGPAALGSLILYHRF